MNFVGLLALFNSLLVTSQSCLDGTNYKKEALCLFHFTKAASKKQLSETDKSLSRKGAEAPPGSRI